MKVDRLIEILSPFKSKNVDVALDTFKTNGEHYNKCLYNLTSITIEDGENLLIKFGFEEDDVCKNKSKCRITNMDVSTYKTVKNKNEAGKNE